MNGIVISLGGLRAHFLGCYGGAFVATPAFDQFAAQALVFDECFVESPAPATTRQNWWTGCYRNFRDDNASASPYAEQRSLISQLRSAGIPSVLVHDSDAVAGAPASEFDAFHRIIAIDRGEKDSTAAVFQAATQWLDQAPIRDRSLLFLCCHGAHVPWYPPEDPDRSELELEEVETEPEDESDDLGDRVASDESSDLSNDIAATDRARQLYAAVLSHLDAELGSFLGFLRSRADWEQSLVLVTSDCGVRIGDPATAVKPSLLNEGCTHIPLLVRVPGAPDTPSRSAALIQPIDLLPTVCDAFDVPVPCDRPGRSLLPIVRSQTRGLRDYVLMADVGPERSIRTSSWHLIVGSSRVDLQACKLEYSIVSPK